MYETMLTIPFPAFYSRNFMATIVMNFMDGVVNPRHHRKAVILQLAAAKASRTHGNRNELKGMKNEYV